MSAPIKVTAELNAKPTTHYRPETRLVHGGTLRSQFGETSEALFLTQGYVYDNSAQAEARFKNEDPGYQYSRFANPTVAMFERRIAEFEGAEAAQRHTGKPDALADDASELATHRWQKLIAQPPSVTAERVLPIAAHVRIRQERAYQTEPPKRLLMQRSADRVALLLAQESILRVRGQVTFVQALERTRHAIRIEPSS